MKSIQVEITGESPILMHAFPLVPLENPPIEKRSPAEQAEISAYRIPGKKTLYLPGTALQRCFVGAAAYSKGKGRASLQKQTAACLLIPEEYLSLGTEDYEIDSRAVVIAATKGRIVRHRPKITNWRCSFTIQYDESLLKASEVRNIVDDAGARVGVLDFRPEKKGPFGRFKVTSWKEISK